jgi:hypothetical protein
MSRRDGQQENGNPRAQPVRAADCIKVTSATPITIPMTDLRGRPPEHTHEELGAVRLRGPHGFRSPGAAARP